MDLRCVPRNHGLGILVATVVVCFSTRPCASTGDQMNGVMPGLNGDAVRFGLCTVALAHRAGPAIWVSLYN
jgi:hypothetical protein